MIKPCPVNYHQSYSFTQPYESVHGCIGTGRSPTPKVITTHKSTILARPPSDGTESVGLQSLLGLNLLFKIPPLLIKDLSTS